MGKPLTRYFLCLQTARRHLCHLVTWYSSLVMCGGTEAVSSLLPGGLWSQSRVDLTPLAKVLWGHPLCLSFPSPRAIVKGQRGNLGEVPCPEPALPN